MAVNAERICDFFVYIRGENLYKVLCRCSCAKYQQTAHLLHQLLWSDRFGFAVPDAFGIVTEGKRFIYDNKSSRVVAGKVADGDSLLRMGKAYLQKIYDDIAGK